jgi:hypothetical protein
MRIVPKRQLSRIEFFESRVARWLEKAEALRLPPESVAKLAAMTASTREALNTQYALAQAGRAATMRLKREDKMMSTEGAALIQLIGARAAQDGDGVYALASLPAPKKRSKMGPPGEPTEITHAHQQIGWLTLRWKCRNPRGAVSTMYELSRSVAGGPFQRIGLSGQRKFIDKTIPAGATSILYKIQPIRSKTKGPVATYIVNLCGDSVRAVGTAALSVQLAA